MGVRTILKMGDPRLHEPSLKVEDLSDPAVADIIADMHSTMQAHNGLGIAAPQIGINQRIILFGSNGSPRSPRKEPVPLTALINPEYEPLSEEMVEDWEGCLSVPGLRGLVPRYLKIRYRGHSQDGTLVEREVSGLHARDVQHECDHIDGILFPARINNMKMFGFTDALPS